MLESEGDSNAKSPSKTDKNDVIVELGKRLRNEAGELKIVAKKEEGSDEEVSYFKTLLNYGIAESI